MNRTLLLVSLLACALTPAHAHEGKKHAPAATLKKEQKPWGIAGDPGKVTRNITLVMNDQMRFVPDRIEAKLGETLRIVLRNEGKMLHEMVIGTRKELDEHAALMLKFPDMEHDEPYMAHVPAGKTGQIVWQFNRAGDFEFACLIAGHYQAGMKGTIRVAPAKAAAVPNKS